MSTAATPCLEALARAAEELLGPDWAPWARNCHAASLHLVQSGLLPAGSRVARGFCDTVPGSQHSWVVVNATSEPFADPYADDVAILDPTAWSYQHGAAALPSVWTSDGDGYVPHGTGGPALTPGLLPTPTEFEKVIIPDPDAFTALPVETQLMFARLGSLDARGWMALMKCDVRTFPAADVVRLMRATPQLRAFVPIDLWGMLTAENPSDVYL